MELPTRTLHRPTLPALSRAPSKMFTAQSSAPAVARFCHWTATKVAVADGAMVVAVQVSAVMPAEKV